MKSQIEIRSLKGIEVRAASEGYIGTLTGYAAVFNSDSVEMAGWETPWIERVAPGAFKRTLVEQPDIKALAQHDSAQILARSPNTLQLREDEKGLAVDIKLVDTSLNRDTLTLVRSGILDSMSFGFVPTKTEWEQGDKRDIRTIKEADLFEVSVVTWPAYPAASIGARGVILANDTESVKAEREAFFKELRASATPSQHLLRLWERRVKFL